MASLAAAQGSAQFGGSKHASAARSRSTSAGSSTEAGRTSEQDGSDVDRTPVQYSSKEVLTAPPGFASVQEYGALGLRTIRPPPGLEDATRAGLLHDKNAIPVPRGAPFRAMPPMPLSFPPPMCALLASSVPPPYVAHVPVVPRLLPPPPSQPPVLGAALTAPSSAQAPLQAPDLDARMSAAFPPSPYAHPLLGPYVQFLCAPPLQPPPLHVQTQWSDALPPPPLGNAGPASREAMQPPPTQAPTLAKDLQAPSIPPPPAQAPTLLLLKRGGSSLPSLGSADHCMGTCKPCAFFHAKGCTQGVDCSYCHLCDAGEKKRRAKVKRDFLRSGNQQAQ